MKKNKSLIYIGSFLITFITIFITLGINLNAAETNYTDPVGYPTTWPGTFTAIKYLGVDMTDTISGNDDSNGGTTPNGDVDFGGSGASGDETPAGPGAFVAGTTGILHFRVRFNTSIVKTSGSG